MIKIKGWKYYEDEIEEFTWKNKINKHIWVFITIHHEMQRRWYTLTWWNYQTRSLRYLDDYENMKRAKTALRNWMKKHPRG